MKMHMVDFTGTVIRATLRYEVFIPELTDVLTEYWPERVAGIEAEYATEGWPHGSGLLFDEPFSDIQQELAPFLLGELVDALGDIAPEGCYFGAREGDGADFGYWPVGMEY